ncbi:MAG: hypothetical protein NVS4B8_08830 [Herpetosiphon sp.]
MTAEQHWQQRQGDAEEGRTQPRSGIAVTKDQKDSGGDVVEKWSVEQWVMNIISMGVQPPGVLRMEGFIMMKGTITQSIEVHDDGGDGDRDI